MKQERFVHFHFVLALSISCSLECSKRVGVHKSTISKHTHVPSPDLLQLSALRLSALMAAGSGPYVTADAEGFLLDLHSLPAHTTYIVAIRFD